MQVPPLMEVHVYSKQLMEFAEQYNQMAELPH